MARAFEIAVASTSQKESCGEYVAGGAVIFTRSRTATGGRAHHHLKHNLWREHASVMFVAFAGKGTLARQIIDGAKTVPLWGDTRVNMPARG